MVMAIDIRIPVMAGPGPATHVFREATGTDVDGPRMGGHDENER